MVVGKVGAAQLCAEDVWRSYAKSIGLRDPWKVRMKNFRNKCSEVTINGVRGTRINMDIPDKIQLEPGEMENYARLKDMFTAAYIFHNCGFEYIDRDFNNWGDSAHMFNPCDGYDCQCTMFCPRFGQPDCYQSPSQFEREHADMWEAILKDDEDD